MKQYSYLDHWNQWWSRFFVSLKVGHGYEVLQCKIDNRIRGVPEWALFIARNQRWATPTPELPNFSLGVGVELDWKILIAVGVRVELKWSIPGVAHLCKKYVRRNDWERISEIRMDLKDIRIIILLIDSHLVVPSFVRFRPWRLPVHFPNYPGGKLLTSVNHCNVTVNGSVCTVFHRKPGRRFTTVFSPYFCRFCIIYHSFTTVFSLKYSRKSPIRITSRI